MTDYTTGPVAPNKPTRFPNGIEAPFVNSNGRFDVKAEGAKSDFSTSCLAAFRATAAKIITRSGIMVIPQSTELASFPGFLVAGNWYDYLGTASATIPGGTTECHGRVILSTGPVILPSGHKLVGDLGVPSNLATLTGSEFLITTSSYPINTAILWLGALSYANEALRPNSTRVERMLINGRERSGVTGIQSNSIQEACGVFYCAIIGCHNGIVIEAYDSGSGVDYGANNFKIEGNHIVMTAASGGLGISVWGGNYVLDKNTCIHAHATTTGDTAFTLRGHMGKMFSGHFEGFDYGVDIGGPDSGDGDDNGYWDKHFVVDGLTGYNYSGQPAIQAMARIRNDSTYIFDVDIRNLEAGSSNIVNLVEDEVNGITIPASNSPTNANFSLGYYRFGGSILRGDAGGTTKRPVFTSYYDHVAPSAAVKAMPVAGTTDLDRSFPGGALAGVVQVTASATPVHRTSSDPKTGASFICHYLQACTISHAAGAGTAEERHLCEGSADLTPAADSFYRFTYGDIRGAAIDAVNYASRWYVEQVA